MDSQYDTFNVTYCVDTKVNNNLFENTGTGSPELCAVRFFFALFAYLSIHF